MCYYRSIISHDTPNNRYQVVILWDDSNPNNMISQTDIYDLKPETIDHAIESMGFRIVGRDDAPALNPGERIVIRNSDRIWFDPKTRAWSTLKPKSVR